MNSQIDIGQVVRKTFGLYRDQAAVLLGAAAAIFVGVLVLGIILGAISPVLLLIVVIFQIVAQLFYTGMVVRLVQDVQDGRRDSTVRQLFESVRGRALTLFVLGLLAGLGIALGLVLLIVPGLVLLTWWAVSAPAAVVEERGATEALGRSRELVRGHGWQVFGVIVTFFLVNIVISVILGVIGAAAGDALGAALRVVGSTLAAPLFALGASVLYFQLRRIKEGDGATGHPASPVVTPPGVPEATPQDH
jgi:MFS family permease